MIRKALVAVLRLGPVAVIVADAGLDDAVVREVAEERHGAPGGSDAQHGHTTTGFRDEHSYRSASGLDRREGRAIRQTWNKQQVPKPSKERKHECL